MAKYQETVLINNINEDLPDNNQGLISAADVRRNMVDIVDSMIPIVSSGDFTAYPFVKNITIQRDAVNNTNGKLIVGSGIEFPDQTFQNTAFLGVAGLQHNSIGGLTAGDPHTQYLPVNGGRQATGDIGLNNQWLNCSGALYNVNRGFHGLQFIQTSASTTQVNVGSGTQFNFLRDASRMNSSRGVAKAWIRFDSSNGNLTVQDCYNVSGVSRLSTGKFLITFTSGVFKDNNYTAFASSNGRGTANTLEDFSEISVGAYLRTGNDDNNGLRSITFGAYDKFNNNFVDAKINELVAFGTEPGGSGYLCTITNTTTTAAP